MPALFATFSGATPADADVLAADANNTRRLVRVLVSVSVAADRVRISRGVVGGGDVIFDAHLAIGQPVVLELEGTHLNKATAVKVTAAAATVFVTLEHVPK